MTPALECCSPCRTVGGILQQLLRDFVAPPEPSKEDASKSTGAQRREGPGCLLEQAHSDCVHPALPRLVLPAHWAAVKCGSGLNSDRLWGPILQIHQMTRAGHAIRCTSTPSSGRRPLRQVQMVSPAQAGYCPGAQAGNGERERRAVLCERAQWSCLPSPLVQGYSLREAQDSFRRAAWKRGWVPAPPPAVVEPQDALSWLAFLPELPASWELSETLLAGQTTYVELPLPGQPGPPCSPRQASAVPRRDQTLRLSGAFGLQETHGACALVQDAGAAGAWVPLQSAASGMGHPVALCMHASASPVTPQAMALADAEHVLRLVNAAPPGNAQVVRIERVQNLELWHRYHRHAFQFF